MSRFVTSVVNEGLSLLPMRPGLQSPFSSSSGDFPHQPLADLQSRNRTTIVIVPIIERVTTSEVSHDHQDWVGVGCLVLGLEHQSARHCEPVPQ